MLTMDTFYEDQQHTITKMKLMKNKMTLDFNSPVSSDKMTKLKTCILESPDLKMLKLASPELERLIIGQSGMVTTTPTPSASLPYYLKQEHQPTEEQEQYAKGFVDALNQLHQTNGQPSHHHMNIDTNNNQNNHTHSHSHNLSHGPTADHSSDLTLTDLNNSRRNSFHVPVTSEAKFAVPSIPSTVPTTASSHTEHYVSVSSGHTNGAHVMINTRSTPLPPYSQAVNNNFYSPMPIKVEPNHCQPKPMRMSPPMVDPLSPQSDTASLTRPIDMADQERIKLERKRLRNRIAASKCRRRKLERISKLEDKVKVLKGENSELSVVVGKLRDQACSLKQQIMDHVKCGCQLMVPQ